MNAVVQQVNTDPGSRNAPCSCGSELKYKHCCGLLSVQLPTQHEIQANENNFQKATAAFEAGDPHTAQTLAVSILSRVPCHLRTLSLLAQIRRNQGKLKAAETLYSRFLAVNPNDAGVSCELTMLLYQRGDLINAERSGRNSVRLNPENPQAHNLMGMILTDQHRLPAAEYHYRKALELHGPIGKLCANFGLNLKQQGKIEEAEEMYTKAMELEPENAESLLGWVRLKEASRHIDEAEKLLSQARTINPEHPALPITNAVLLKRKKKLDEALTALDEMDTKDKEPKGLVGWNYERGDILDKLEKYDEAFAAFDAANQAILESGLRKYERNYTTNLVERLKAFFTKERVALLPTANPPEEGRSKPIFIVGFPRSGTTMVEQILTSHPKITAGDELHFIWDLTRIGQQILNSDLTYPEFLADLWMGDNQGALDNFRDYYLKKSAQIGASDPEKPWFTDKMPLNETNLGLMHLIFPQSPVIHLIRHPLDVILSCYFNDLTHGNNMSYGLETAAHQYTLIRGLVDHYIDNLDIRYHTVKYEDIVEEPENKVKELLDFPDVKWDDKCLEFHKNKRYARTASYAQVTEKLYTSSVFRYKNYLKHLESIIPIVEPVINQLGYDI